MTHKKNFVITACIIGIMAGVAALIAAPAFAEEPSVTVHYGDLNIAHRPGAEALVGRIAQGAKQVCGQEPYISDLRGYASYRACVQASTDRAVASVDQPVVTEAYLHKYGQRERIAGR